MTGELQITDGTLYFLNQDKLRQVYCSHPFILNISKLQIFSDSYTPTDDDILHARDPTTGITDYRFSINNMRIMIHDIGGQKVERVRSDSQNP